MAKLFLGIDLGGTEVKIAVVDDKGTIRDEASVPNEITSEPSKLVASIVHASKQFKDFKKLAGTGVGVAGDIDQANGIVRFSPNLKKWNKVPLRKMLEKELPKPVVIDNDANAAALGAFWLDAKGKVKNLVCVTLGTGVGGGLVCEGKLYRGTTGTAGEIGHMPINPEGPCCNCGSHGCIERYVGARFISAHAAEMVKKEGSTIISRLVEGNLAAITPRILAQAAEMNDPVACKIWEDAGTKLGVIFASVINFINPEMIVLAGGVSQAGNLLLNPIKETVKARGFATPVKACRIIISHSTHKLGVVGAALLAK